MYYIHTPCAKYSICAPSLRSGDKLTLVQELSSLALLVSICTICKLSAQNSILSSVCKRSDFRILNSQFAKHSLCAPSAQSEFFCTLSAQSKYIAHCEFKMQETHTLRTLHIGIENRYAHASVYIRTWTFRLSNE